MPKITATIMPDGKSVTEEVSVHLSDQDEMDLEAIFEMGVNVGTDTHQEVIVRLAWDV